jgi:glycogen synthase
MKQTLIDGLNDFETNKEARTSKLIQRADFFNWDKSAKEYIDVYRSLL